MDKLKYKPNDILEIRWSNSIGTFKVIEHVENCKYKLEVLYWNNPPNDYPKGYIKIWDLINRPIKLITNIELYSALYY